MIAKSKEKALAVALRRQGKTYREIRAQVPVAKSTISLWLREVGLAKEQKQRITEKRIAGQKKGAAAKKQQRVERMGKIIEEARKEVGELSKRELWLIGVALYWAEGHKEKEYAPGTPIHFSNSDPAMLRVSIRFMRAIFNINDDDFIFSVYIHKSALHKVEEARSYWAKELGFPRSFFSKIIIKKTFRSKRSRRKDTALYFGQMRVSMRSSSGLLRKITGWTKGIIDAS